MKGYVYVLTNDAMPGLVKIGRTTQTPYSRADDLSRASGVPIPFRVAMYASFPDCIAAERFVHKRMAGWRLSAHREFFQGSEDGGLVDMVREALSWLYHNPDRLEFAAAPWVLQRLEIENPSETLNPWKVVL